MAQKDNVCKMVPDREPKERIIGYILGNNRIYVVDRSEAHSQVLITSYTVFCMMTLSAIRATERQSLAYNR